MTSTAFSPRTVLRFFSPSKSLIYGRKCTSYRLARPLPITHLSYSHVKPQTFLISASLPGSPLHQRRAFLQTLPASQGKESFERVKMADMRAVATEDAFSRNDPYVSTCACSLHSFPVPSQTNQEFPLNSPLLKSFQPRDHMYVYPFLFHPPSLPAPLRSSETKTQKNHSVPSSNHTDFDLRVGTSPPSACQQHQLNHIRKHIGIIKTSNCV